MIQPRKRRARDPEATRSALIEAACALLAKDGPDGISLSEVALRAGANRGTAYQHFETREKLVEAAMTHVSETMFRAVFGDPATIGERAVERVDMVDVTERLAAFAMENTDLCRIWLMQILASPDPAADPFWREYSGSIGRFAHTELAEPGIDVDVFSVLTLAGNFLWPVWARSHSQGKAQREALSHRFAKEMLRLSLHGTLRADKVPAVVAQLESEEQDGAALRIVN